MLFNVPLAYMVTGTPKGRKNETEEQFWEYVEIDIPVLPDDAAPVAVTWDDRYPVESAWLKHQDDWSRDQNVPESGIQVMRMKNGEFYIRRPDELTPERLAAKLNPQADFRIFGEDFIHFRNKGGEKPVDSVEYRQDKPFSSKFEDEVAKLRLAAERFFIIGDDIFERSSEPVAIKVNFQSTGGGGYVPRIIPSHQISNLDTAYCLDRYAQLVEELDDLAVTYLKGRYRVTMERAPTIHLAGAIGFNDLSLNFVNSVRTYIEKYNDSVRLANCNPDEGIAFLQLRKALVEYDMSHNINILEESARILVENFPSTVQHFNFIPNFRAYADRPIDTLEVGAWRKGR
jgi:hypothetical protein